jgi:hypothetical protein
MSTLHSLYYEVRPADDGRVEHMIHVAEDLADGEVVIELQGLGFHANVSRDAIELRLPLKVWAAIRVHTPADERYLTISDSELRAEAESWVQRRIDEYDPARPLTGVGGSAQAGMASDPADVQIERYIRYYQGIRDGNGPDGSDE